MSNKRTYTDEFKKQIVSLYKNGKTTASLVKEYGISAAAVYLLIVGC
jgi:transposase